MADDNKQMTDPHKPPPRPWVRGKHKEHAVFHLGVRVCENEYGWTFSESDFADPQDRDIAAGLSSGGHRQIAYAMLNEACRREVFLDVLIHLSEKRDVLNGYRNGTPEERLAIEKDLSTTALTVMTKTLGKMMQPTVRGVLEMMMASSQSGA